MLSLVSSHSLPIASEAPLGARPAQEFIGRVLAFEDGSLRGEALRGFERELLASGAKRRLFVETRLRSQRLTEVLRRQALRAPETLAVPESGEAPALSEPFEAAAASLPVGAHLRWYRRWLGAAAAFFLGAAFMAEVLRLPSKSAPPSEVAPVAVALLTQSLELQWNSQPHRPGALLAGGWMRLEAGCAVVDLLNGARLIVEGPAEVRLISANYVFCRSGRISVEVPSSTPGFRLQTPRLNVMASGARFGVGFSVAGTQVHALEGTIEVMANRAPATVLSGGTALFVDARSRVCEFAARPADFLSANQLAQRVRLAIHDRHEDWKNLGARLKEDPALKVRFDFEKVGPDRVLANRSAGAGECGAIVGASWEENGRWGGKGALEFHGAADRVRMEVRGRFEALTAMVWVRVHALDRECHSLFTSQPGGALRWSLNKDATLRLTVRDNAGHPHEFQTRNALPSEWLTQWLHLAVALDPRSGTLVFYGNGRVFERMAWPAKFGNLWPSLGFCELGNAAQEIGREWHGPSLALNGRMDEFALFSRALAAPEIAEIVRAGMP